MDYSFRQEFRGLDAPNFVHPVIEAGDLMLVYAQWGLYFRKFFLFLDLITDWIPSKVLRVLSPQLSSMKKFQAVGRLDAMIMRLLNHVLILRSRVVPKVCKS
jgi:hypothetical protein